ncbi:uncharacterized protein [Anoplolepis gracilipes]|uniref:uncharacterized protein n=1 Tax=Anoplolepis gracilipes TaxID=354296 RepID=UPI003B9DEC82
MRSEAMALIAAQNSYEQQRRRHTTSNMRQSGSIMFAFLLTSIYALLLLFHFSHAVQFEDCGSTLGKFSVVSVSGCKVSDERCTLVRGTNASIAITFTPNQDIETVDVLVYGVLFAIPIPFPLNNPDVCKDPDAGVKCPLHKDQVYDYKTSLFVLKQYPSLDVDIKWELVDEDGNKIICVQFPVEIEIENKGDGYCWGMWRALQRFIKMRSETMALIAARNSYEQQRRRRTTSNLRQSENIMFAFLSTSIYALLLLFHFSYAVQFEDCGSILGKFSEVSVSGCQESDESCALVRGTNASISIKFTANQDIETVNVRVYGVLSGVPIPFPFNKPDVCKDLDAGVKCPLHKNQEYDYKTSLFVQKKFPPVSVDIKWELVDENGNKIICVQFPAKVE